MTTQNTPAGWYPDPQTPGQQRYWDGSAWSEATQPAAVAATDFAQPAGYGYAQGIAADDASFGQRAVAYILDALIVGIPFAILYGIAFAISDALGILAYLVGLVGIVYYFAYFEGGPTGQTIGKRTLGIRVVDANSLQPGIGMGRGVGRYFARILSSFLCGLGYWWMLWDPRKQCWHDHLVTTKVTRV